MSWGWTSHGDPHQLHWWRRGRTARTRGRCPSHFLKASLKRFDFKSSVCFSLVALFSSETKNWWRLRRTARTRGRCPSLLRPLSGFNFAKHCTALVENIGFQIPCLLFFGGGIFIWNFAVQVLPRIIWGELNIIATNTVLRFTSPLDDDFALATVQQRERMR